MPVTIKEPPKAPVAKSSVKPEVNGSVDRKSEEEIRLLAYLKWEAAGKPTCDGLCYWLEAERELRPA